MVIRYGNRARIFFSPKHPLQDNCLNTTSALVRQEFIFSIWMEMALWESLVQRKLMQGIIFPLKLNLPDLLAHMRANNAGDNECTFLFSCFHRRLEFVQRLRRPSHPCMLNMHMPHCPLPWKARQSSWLSVTFSFPALLFFARFSPRFMRISLLILRQFSAMRARECLSQWIPFLPHVPKSV